MMLAVWAFCAMTVRADQDMYAEAQTFDTSPDSWIGRYVAGIDRLQADNPHLMRTYLQWATDPVDGRYWDAEHIGKWLEIATLSWRRTKSPEVRALIDEAVTKLASAQLPNGYLGSYAPRLRFYVIDWQKSTGPVAPFDLWCNLTTQIGLLDVYDATGSETALKIARANMDLVIETFGKGRADLLKVMHNRGQGPLVAILPAARLFAIDRNPKYADFCRHIMAQFGRPQSLPVRIVESADAPASELLLNEPERVTDDGLKHCEFELIMRGLLRFYRASGEKAALNTSEAVFSRIYAPLLPTLCVGGYGNPDTASPVVHHRQPVETCDIPPALRWWHDAFLLTGRPQYLHAIERTLYNQLLAHHRPVGYHLGFDSMAPVDFSGALLEKRYRASIPDWRQNCCLSMGALGLEWIPSAAVLTSGSSVVVNLYMPGVFDAGGFRLRQKTDYPAEGEVKITVESASASPSAITLRIPEWAAGAAVQVNAEAPVDAKPGSLHELRRAWKAQDVIALRMPMPLQIIPVPGAKGRLVRLERGPLVLAASQRHNGKLDLRKVAISSGGSTLTRVKQTNFDDEALALWETDAIDTSQQPGKQVKIRLCALSDAGWTLGRAKQDPYIVHFVATGAETPSGQP